METLLSQAEQLPSLLAVSRSGLVRGWDGATLQRALGWGRFFRQLHSRLDGQPGLRAALERRLCRGRGGFSLGHLRRCPELLGLALLENRALPPTAYQRLLRGLLLPGGGRDDGSFVPLLARRRAASQLLCLHSAAPPPKASAGTPELRAQAQLLLSRLQEEAGGGDVPPSSALLDQLPCSLLLYRVVATALLEPPRETEAATLLLLPWLLQGDPARLSAFCRLLPAPWMASLCGRYPELRAHYFGLLAAWGSRLSYDPLRGEWRVGGLEEDPVPWQEMRERVGGLLQEPEPLRSAIRTQLSRLKAQDGDFEVRGLSVWTDLLLDLETTASNAGTPREGKIFLHGQKFCAGRSIQMDAIQCVEKRKRVRGTQRGTDLCCLDTTCNSRRTSGPSRRLETIAQTLNTCKKKRNKKCVQILLSCC